MVKKGCGLVRNFPSEAAQNEMRRRQDSWLRPILFTKAFDALPFTITIFPATSLQTALPSAVICNILVT